jgi:hypothetical protein
MDNITADQRNRTGRYELDSAGSDKEPVVNCCKYDNEPWGSI